MNGCVKCFAFLVVVAVFGTFVMIYTSSDSTEANMFSISNLAKKEYLQGALAKASEHKDRIKGAISQQYNALLGDKASQVGTMDDLFMSSPTSDGNSDNNYHIGSNAVVEQTAKPQTLVNAAPNSQDEQGGGTSLSSTAPPTTSTTPSSASPTSPPTPSDNTSEEKSRPHAVDSKALLAHVHSQCVKYGLSTESPFDSRTVKQGGIYKLVKKNIWPRMVIGSYEHRLMYSSNPKCGSTSFKKFLIRVHGDTTDYLDMHGVHMPRKHENVKEMMALERERIIKENKLDTKLDKDRIDTMVLEALQSDFYKVGFIRNPLTRLMSGFRDKVLRRHRYSEELKQDIGHDNPTDQEMFYSFVKLISLGKIKNLHYMPQYDKMKICTFPYDMLGQVETTDEQIPIIQRKTGLTDVEFPGSRSQTGLDRNSTQDVTKSFYSGMPPDILQMFYKFYKMDFELTGYTKLDDPNFPYLVLPSKH